MSQLTPTRRTLLGAVAGASILRGCAPVPALADGPDAELIRLCAEFTALERRRIDLLEATDDDVDEGDGPYASISDRQDELLPPILALRATTLPGLLARARMLGLYEPEWVKPGNIENSGSNNERMAGALVRDMMAMGA